MSRAALARARDRVQQHAVALTLGCIGIVSAAYLALGFSRRWISDDGMIVVRTVRQILEGNGPNFNAFERAEANTSTLWQWILALVGLVTRQDVARLAVFSGLVLAVAGFAVALDGTRRLQRERFGSQLLLPAGALVVLAVSPFWDYATSGLETGLCLAWIGAAWHQLVLLRPETTRARQLGVAVLFGAGPLVRPDFAIATLFFLVAMYLIVRPSWRRTGLLVVVAGALPVAYEIFRMGYYGTLVPLPAIAKGASGAEWSRGAVYLIDFVRPYRLWLPLAALLVIGIAARGSGDDRRKRIVMLAPVLAGLVMGTFIVRVGGDFMHGRMLLPATFLVILPVLLLPVSRLTAPALVVVAGWAFMTYGKGRPINDPNELITDERRGYVMYTGVEHPIDGRAYLGANPAVVKLVDDAVRTGRKDLVTEAGLVMPMAEHHAAPIAIAVGRLGFGGLVAPLDGIVADTLGLANPLGARITVTNPGHTGHEKVLPWAWTLADFSRIEAGPEGTPPLLVRAARNAMACGELAELLRSVRDPMTPSRFWANLTGAVHRTRLVIPSNPIDAEWKFCGTNAKTPRVQVSSSYESPYWSKLYLADGVQTSVLGGSMGFSTAPGHHAPQWVEIEFPAPRPISKVVLHPRTDDVGLGFPIDFTIETWDGGRWVAQARFTNVARPTQAGGVPVAWDGAVTTTRVRLVATKMGPVEQSAQLMLAEFEVP